MAEERPNVQIEHLPILTHRRALKAVGLGLCDPCLARLEVDRRPDYDARARQAAAAIACDCNLYRAARVRIELAEEIGLTAAALFTVGVASANCDGRRNRAHFFELRLVEPPKLRLDNREVIEARLISPSELQNMALTRSVAAYLACLQSLGCRLEPT